MNKIELGKVINKFVKLNPKTNKYPNFNKYALSSFSIIKNQFKENKKYIITSNYDDIFYNKNNFLNGKKWIEIILSSKDIFEYHKKIRDDFPFCKQKKLMEKIIEDLFFWFDKNTKKIIIDSTESNFDIELRKKLENIRYFLDKKDWSNFFFNLQKLMHEQIIKFLSWENKNLDYASYSKILKQKLSKIINENLVEEYFIIIQKINLYRNTLSKINNKILNLNKKILEEWKNFSNIEKTSICWKIYFELLTFINLQNLILNKNYV